MAQEYLRPICPDRSLCHRRAIPSPAHIRLRLSVNVEVGFYSGVEAFAIHDSVDVALADEGAVQRLFLP